MGMDGRTKGRVLLMDMTKVTLGLLDALGIDSEGVVRVVYEHRVHEAPSVTVERLIPDIEGDFLIPKEDTYLCVRKGRDDDRHIIEFRNDGWTIQHPLSERIDGSLFDCEYARWTGGDPGIRGRWYLTLDSEDGLPSLDGKAGP